MTRLQTLALKWMLALTLVGLAHVVLGLGGLPLVG